MKVNAILRANWCHFALDSQEADFSPKSLTVGKFSFELQDRREWRIVRAQSQVLNLL